MLHLFKIFFFNRNFYLMLSQLDIFEYYKETNLLIIRNNLDWFHTLKSNKHLNHTIHKLGHKPGNFSLMHVFRKFYHDLFRLVPKLQNKFNEFMKIAKPDNETKLICAQIRIGGARPNVKYDNEFLPRNSSKLFWNFIRETFINVYPRIKYKIFITTDTESVEEESIKEFGEDIVKIDGDFIHIDREEYGNTNDCTRSEKVILDFHALQFCDMAIISPSGFGRYGVANRINPAKDLYMYEILRTKQRSITGEINIKKSYFFKKVNSL